MEQRNKHIKKPQNVGVPTVLAVPANGTKPEQTEQRSALLGTKVCRASSALTPVNKLLHLLHHHQLLSSKMMEKADNKKAPTSVGASGTRLIIFSVLRLR